MIFADLIWLVLIFGLPTMISLRLFEVEPKGRAFLATWALSVIGSHLAFIVIALLLALLNIGLFAMFDGLIVMAVSIPVALIVGVIARMKRNRASALSMDSINAPD